MCIKTCLIFSYLSECKLQINGDNNPQVLIYMPVIDIPFHKPDCAYTANSISRGYKNSESFCNSYVCTQCLK